MEKANCNDTVKVKKKKDFLRWWKLIVMQVFVLILTAAVLVFTWADIVIYQANEVTYESTQFTQQDVEKLRSLFGIPKHIDVEFVKILQHPGWTQDMNYSEAFFYIDRQDLESFIGAVYIKDWKRNWEKDSYHPIVFDDGQQYIHYVHFKKGHYSLVILNPQFTVEYDKYLVFIKDGGTIELDNMNRIAASKETHYETEYGILIKYEWNSNKI